MSDRVSRRNSEFICSWIMGLAAANQCDPIAQLDAVCQAGVAGPFTRADLPVAAQQDNRSGERCRIAVTSPFEWNLETSSQP